MKSGVTTLLENLSSELSSGKSDCAIAVCHQLLENELSNVEMHEVVEFLKENYKNLFMLKDFEYEWHEGLRVDFLTAIFIECASRCLADEVKSLLSLEGIQISTIACYLARKEAEENDDEDHSLACQEVINALFDYDPNIAVQPDQPEEEDTLVAPRVIDPASGELAALELNFDRTLIIDRNQTEPMELIEIDSANDGKETARFVLK